MNLSSMSNVALLVISVYYPPKNSPTKKLTIQKRVAAEAILNQQSIFCSLFIISAQQRLASGAARFFAVLCTPRFGRSVDFGVFNPKNSILRLILGF
jgi:hypothetical protein